MSVQRSTGYPRVGVTALIVATGLVILGARLVWLGAISARHAEAETPETAIAAPRGTLWDRRGALVAAESYDYEVAAVPKDIADPAGFAQAVAGPIGKTPDEVQADMTAGGRYWAILQHGLAKPQADALRAQAITGLRLERAPRRTYPLGAAAGHITGFWNAFDGKAYYGIEARYDSELRGRSGSMVGNFGTDPRTFRPARRGNDLILTLDRDIQLAAATALADILIAERARSGTIVVLDPGTGGILADTSLPTFDPGDYSASDPKLFADPSISLVYEPGSVIKAFTMAAALDAGVTSVGATYEDTGSVDVDGAPIYNWDRLPHGTTTMTELMQQSLNVGAVHLALGLGADRFYRYLAAFGFGAPTGVDLDGEIGGLVHVPGDGSQWSTGTLARNSFGQSMAATPVQVASAMAAIANGGRLMVPHIVAARILPDGRTEAVLPQMARQVIQPATADEMRKMLEDVVGGHVTQAAIPGFRVAGKTGTSQIPIPGGYDPDKTIASFCGFLPAEHPRVVILVVVDRPDAPRGQEVAAPVFRKVAEAAIAALDIPAEEGQ